jgi:hypothetical protein
VNFALLILACSFENVVAMFAYTIQKVSIKAFMVYYKKQSLVTAIMF